MNWPVPVEDYPTCPQCGADMDFVECETCSGEGFDGHDCGEDTCCCLNPEENMACGICDGDGGWELCPKRCKVDQPQPVQKGQG